MNNTEKRMLDILLELKNEHDVLAIKAEFEAEGSRTDELVKLNEIVFRADMDLFIKIGGCEAVRDLDQCRLLGARGIMAPMIETPYAMEKFKNAAQKVYRDDIKGIEWIINAETKTCHANFDDILQVGDGFLNTVSIGRVDLSGSMGLTRDEINGDKVYDAVRDMALRARLKGFIVNFGGGISLEAIPFIMKIYPLIDKFETRKVVFQADNDGKRLKIKIFKAMEFEILYLENKCDFYGRMANEDRARMEMLKARFEAARENCE